MLFFDLGRQHEKRGPFGPSIKSGTWNIPEHAGTSRNIPEHEKIKIKLTIAK